MALSMARPWKHPQTGIFWFRKRIPKDLLPILGKLEEKFSLKTRDPAEAKRLHAKFLAEVEERWANLRTPPKTITERDAHELVAGAYDWWLAQYQDNPSEQKIWNPKLYEKLWAPPNFTLPKDRFSTGIRISSPSRK